MASFIITMVDLEVRMVIFVHDDDQDVTEDDDDDDDDADDSRVP